MFDPPKVDCKTIRRNGFASYAATRSEVLPDLSIIAEAGVPGAGAGTWCGMLAPTAVPVMTKLNAETVKASGLPDVRERLGTRGVEVIGGTSKQFTAEIESDIL